MPPARHSQPALLFLLVPFVLLVLACEGSSAEDVTPTPTRRAVASATPRPTATASPEPDATPIRPPETTEPGASGTPVVSCQPDETSAPTPTLRPGQTPAPPSPRVTARPGVQPGGSHTPLPLLPDAGLTAAIEGVVRDLDGTYAVYAQDLATGRGAAVNADTVFYAASLFKILVMYEAFNQVEQGILSLDDRLTITPYYDSFGLGPRATVLCQRVTVREALYAMMSVSDNAAAVLLQDVVGSGNANNSARALGMQVHEIIEALPVTATDLALILDAIARGQAVSEAASRQMVELLLGERISNGLTRPLPDEVVVAHKTGNWSNATHDVGIVYAPGVTYLLVILSDRDHVTSGIAAISEAVYEYMTR
jgi:beta-lactamase class A